MTADRPGKSELALVAGLLLLLVLSVTVAPGREGDLELFFGRFHPALVHLPIGVLLFAVLLEGILRSSRFGAGGHAVAAVLLVGAWSAILAAVAGLYLAQGGGYVASTLLWHRRLGIGIAVVAVTAYVFKKRALRQATEQPGYVFLLSLACIGVVVGGHLGGELTRGEGYLTRYMPDGVRTIAGLPPKAAIGQLSIERPEEATVYSALIEPVFAERCATCHNGIELRGGLRLDAPEGILEGGQSGEVLVAGRAEASELIRRMWLPIEHDDHMPPEDRPQPSVAQAELIRWWIDRGASFDAKLSEAETTPIVQAIFDGYGLDEIRTGIFALDVAPPAAGAVEALRALGAAVSELGEDEPFLEVRCVVEACTGEILAAALEPVAKQVAWLDLGNSPVDDASLSTLARLSNLTRLHLEGTAVTDAGLSHLAELPYLEYLNLYATSVTDDGLQHLTELPRLRALYLWQTGVTAEGAERLRDALPGLEINLGVTMPSASVERP